MQNPHIIRQRGHISMRGGGVEEDNEKDIQRWSDVDESFSSYSILLLTVKCALTTHGLDTG